MGANQSNVSVDQSKVSVETFEQCRYRLQKKVRQKYFPSVPLVLNHVGNQLEDNSLKKQYSYDHNLSKQLICIQAAKKGDIFTVRKHVKKCKDSICHCCLQALQAAVTSRQTRVVHCLLVNGVDVNHSFPLLHTVPDRDRKYGFNLVIVLMLIEAGADVNHVDNSGVSALSRAEENGCSVVAKVLRDNGAVINKPVYDKLDHDDDAEPSAPIFNKLDHDHDDEDAVPSAPAYDKLDHDDEDAVPSAPTYDKLDHDNEKQVVVDKPVTPKYTWYQARDDPNIFFQRRYNSMPAKTLGSLVLTEVMNPDITEVSFDAVVETRSDTFHKICNEMSQLGVQDVTIHVEKHSMTMCMGSQTRRIDKNFPDTMIYVKDTDEVTFVCNIAQLKLYSQCATLEPTVNIYLKSEPVVVFPSRGSSQCLIVSGLVCETGRMMISVCPVDEKQETVAVDDDTDELRLCVVCCDNEKNMVFLNCGHVATCPDCCVQVKTCPICRAPKTETRVVYY